MRLKDAFSVLKERVLWFDGDSSYFEDETIDRLLYRQRMGPLYTVILTDEMKQYNKLANEEDQILIKRKLKTIDPMWNIPDKYMTMDLELFVFKKLQDECEHLSDVEVDIRIARVKRELKLITKFNLEPMFRTSIYIVDTFNQTDSVWGVGRGSSTSSYILYLVGIHDVDSVLYDLNATEFFK